MWGKHISLFIYNFIMIFFVKVRLEQILDSHREMFLNKPSQQNVGKIPTIEFCDDCFTALVTAFGTINFLHVSKNILKQKSSWFCKNEKRAYWKYNYSFSNWKHELKQEFWKLTNCLWNIFLFSDWLLLNWLYLDYLERAFMVPD